jgi:aldehyde:ferredoxin oxidoreductase
MKILRVNMSELSTRFEDLPEEMLVLGGRGLTSKILCDEVAPDVDPLGSEAKLVIATGPLAATMAPSCGRLSVGAKSPLTHGIKEANTGGPIGQKLDRLGIRAIVVEGESKDGKLHLLHISNDKVSLTGANELLGKGNYQVAEELRAEYGDKTIVATIGVAGERKSKAAAITFTDTEGRSSRHAARGGLGAVMCAKGLKAMVIDDKGASPATIADKEAFKEAVKAWAEFTANHELLKHRKLTGTPGFIDVLGTIGAMPTNNYGSAQPEGFEALSTTSFGESNKARGGAMHGCMPGCLVKCSVVYHGPDKKHLTSSLEYETLALLGTNIGITDPDVVATLDRACDELGVDTIELGSAFGVAASEGKMKVGDAASALALMEEVKSGTEFGKVLADGVVATCKALGVERIPAFKGQSIPAHDPRVTKPTGVTYATNPMGADHTAGLTYDECFSAKGAVKRSLRQQIFNTVFDSLGFCILAGPDDRILTVKFLRKLLNARFGLDLEIAEILQIGRQTLKRELDFNQQSGFHTENEADPDFIRNEPVAPFDAVFDVDPEEIKNIWAELDTVKLFTNLAEESYRMPAHFGPTPVNAKASGWYRDVTMMIVPYLTDRAKLAALLPEPFEVAEEPIITVMYACNKDIDWLAGRGYNLVGVSAAVVYKGEKEQLEGQYSLVMWENLTDPILSGRELQGIPKIFADIPEHSIDGDNWATSASHYDNKIVDVSISNLRAPTTDEIVANQKAQEGKDNPMSWRYMPGIGGFGASVNEMTTFPSESLFTGAWIGEGKVEWNRLTWEQNPTQYHIVNGLADLPILEYRPAFVTTGSSNLIVADKPTRVLDQDPPAEPDAKAAFKTIDEIETVCFVGAGTMGCVNSLIAGLAGYDVVIYDVSQDNLNKVPERYQEIAPYLVASGVTTHAAIAAVAECVVLEADLTKATANADLVSESIFERKDVKREVHRQLDQVCPVKTILTTNTSSFLVSEIEDAVERGDRFAAMHAYLGSMLIDIVGGPRTSPDVIDILKRYVLSLGGNPLVLNKEYPGYVMNAMLAPVLMTANLLVGEGIATFEEIDRVWMSRRKIPMGPFGMLDLFGLDLSLDNMKEEHPDPYINMMKQKVAPVIAPYVERGELGMKTGKGFYSYPDPAYQQPGFLDGGEDDTAIYYELITGLIQAAVMIVANGVASFEDVDRAWMIASTQENGPFGILDEIGIDTFLAILDKQVRMKVFSPESVELVKLHLVEFVERNETGEKTGKGFYNYPNPEYKTPGFLTQAM